MEINCVDGLVERLRTAEVPWDVILPPEINSWLQNAAASKSTTKGILYSTLLTTTSSLISTSTLCVYPGYNEHANIFILVLAPSATGKSPACSFGCSLPLLNTVEISAERTILIEESSVAGLFSTYVQRKKETTLLICVDEAFRFLSKISQTKTNKADITMERMCKLYDGGQWLKTQGNKAKRVGVNSARATALMFTTPRRILAEVWPKLCKYGEGLTARFMIFYDEKPNGNDRVGLREQEMASRAVTNSPIKTMDTVFGRIAFEHETNVEYTLSERAKNAFYTFDEEELRQTSEKEDKSRSNALKVVLCTHVLHHRLMATLSLDASSPTPREISEDTLRRGLAFFDVLRNYSAIAEHSAELHTSVSLNTVTEDDIFRRVFSIDGPFVVPRRVANSFTSLSRPSTDFVKNVFSKLASESLGTTATVPQCGSPPVLVFYKVFPSQISPENLMKISMTRSVYLQSFAKSDAQLSETQVRRFANRYPGGFASLEAELRREENEIDGDELRRREGGGEEENAREGAGEEENATRGAGEEENATGGAGEEENATGGAGDGGGEGEGQ